jgi:glutathione S-transferase
MLKIYGTAMSRASRTLWTAEELGLKFEHVPVGFADGGTKAADYLKINPNGHVPAIDDDGTILCESMAITLYLVEKYGHAPLWPATVEGRGRAYQWSFWGMMECEGPLLDIFRNRMMLPEGQRSEKAVAEGIAALKKPLKVLDDHLKDHQHLLGRDFSVADLNVAGVLILAPMLQLDMSDVPAANAWLTKCLERPALQKSRSYG